MAGPPRHQPTDNHRAPLSLCHQPNTKSKPTQTHTCTCPTTQPTYQPTNPPTTQQPTNQPRTSNLDTELCHSFFPTDFSVRGYNFSKLEINFQYILMSISRLWVSSVYLPGIVLAANPRRGAFISGGREIHIPKTNSARFVLNACPVDHWTTQPDSEKLSTQIRRRRNQHIPTPYEATLAEQRYTVGPTVAKKCFLGYTGVFFHRIHIVSPVTRSEPRNCERFSAATWEDYPLYNQPKTLDNFPWVHNQTHELMDSTGTFEWH